MTSRAARHVAADATYRVAAPEKHSASADAAASGGLFGRVALVEALVGEAAAEEHCDRFVGDPARRAGSP